MVITDRNDLDDQLYGQFAKCSDFLRQVPVQATCRKLGPNSSKDDIGLIEKVDAETGKIKVGTARIIRNSLPNATYVGFTGTPISMKDRSTKEVFGDYIDVYDMTQAVEDGATRPVYYESRVIKLKLDEATLKLIDAEYD